MERNVHLYVCMYVYVHCSSAYDNKSCSSMSSCLLLLLVLNAFRQTKFCRTDRRQTFKQTKVHSSFYVDLVCVFTCMCIIRISSTLRWNSFFMCFFINVVKLENICDGDCWGYLKANSGRFFLNNYNVLSTNDTPGIKLVSSYIKSDWNSTKTDPGSFR